MTQETIITQWTHMNPWRRNPASTLNAKDRSGARYTLYTADYYGNGQHTFLRAEPMFQCDDESAPRMMPGGSNDGHPERIARYLQTFGVTIPE